jgi:hypothetical protein
MDLPVEESIGPAHEHDAGYELRLHPAMSEEPGRTRLFEAL